MRVSGKIALQLFLKILRHAESSFAVDARRNADGAASVGGLIYNTLLLAIIVFMKMICKQKQSNIMLIYTVGRILLAMTVMEANQI